MKFEFSTILQNGRHAHFIDYLATVNSGVSAIALFPQLFALVMGRPSGGLSTLSFSLIAFNSVIWFMYGIHRRAPPLIISSAFNTIASVGIVLMILLKS